MISPGNILFFLRRSARTASSLRPFQLIVPTRRKRNDAAILSKLHFIAYSCDNLLDISVYSIEKCTNDDSRNTVEIRIFRRLTRFDLLRWRFFSPSPLDKNLSPYRSSFTREKGRSFEFDRSTSSWICSRKTGFGNPDDLPIKLVPSRFTSSVEQWKKKRKKKKKHCDHAIFVSRMMKPRIFSSVAELTYFSPFELVPFHFVLFRSRSFPILLVKY